jgi:putative Mg2+ transporter-C (MgtC) family protein
VITHTEMLLRIVVGGVLGGAIGYERDRRRHPMGLRTHLIVAMASATFTVVSTQFVYAQHYGDDDLVHVDPSRIASAVVTAVGFLAGGAIVRTGISIQGLTTAAAIWLVTAIGMCAGAGMYVEGVAATVLGLAALTGLRWFEERGGHFVPRRVCVELDDKAKDAAAVVEALRAIDATVEDLEYEKRLDGDKARVVVTLRVECTDKVTAARLVEIIEAVSGVRRVVVQQSV